MVPKTNQSNSARAVPNRAMKRQLASTPRAAKVQQANQRLFGSRPAQQRREDMKVRIARSEFIGDIAGSVAFANTQYPINPGMAATFPWLSQIAPNFEHYEFEQLSFELRSEIVLLTASGTTYLCPDYDAADDAPTDKATALAYADRAGGRAADSHLMTCSRKQLTRKYVRTDALASNLDIKTYDVGNMNVATVGQADTSAVAELWVHYVVVLDTPQAAAVSQAATSARWTGTANSAPYGTEVFNTAGVSLISSGTTTSLTTFTFSKPYTGQLVNYFAGSGLAGVTVGGTAGAELGDVINSGGTLQMQVVNITALAGETVTVTVANTTISSANCHLSGNQLTA